MGYWIKEAFTFDDLQRIMFRLIDRVQVFHGLSGEELLQLLEVAEKCSFAEGDTIVREGSTGAWIYIIIDGEVAVRKTAGHQVAELARLNPGETFGEMSLIDMELRSASVVALQPCVLLRLKDSALDRRPASAAKVYRNIAHIISHRLRDMDDAYIISKQQES